MKLVFLVSAALLVVLSPAPSAEAGPLSKPASGQEPACACHDVDPRSDFWRPFVPGQDMSCFEQAQKGGCGQAFMKSAIAEVGEYCAISCGSCPCCDDLLTVAAERAGAREFAWAFNATKERLRRDRAPLSAPGFMATVLAPPDDAVASVVRRLGGRAKIAADDGAREALSAIVAAHILRPEPEFNAAWTSPFLKSAAAAGGGRRLATYADGVSLKVAGGGAGGVVFTPVVDKTGAEGSASARLAADGSGRLDLEACKGAVVGVDQVILPFALLS